jgi:DNA-binding GntR family transcriptional regulator
MSHNTFIPRSPTLTEQAYGGIRERLIRGMFDGGMSIPSLAKELGVSRTPIREAILRLAREGFIEILPNKGFVAKPLKEETIKEIFLIRAALESLALVQLVPKVTKRQIAMLSRNLDIQRRTGSGVRGWDPFIEVDREFHLMLAKFAGLDITQEILTNLLDLMVMTKGSSQFVTRRADIIGEHEKIVNALKRRDVKASLKAVASHIDRSEDYLRAFLADSAEAAQPEPTRR